MRRSWWQKLDQPYVSMIALEVYTTSISGYNTAVVPGLRQTEGLRSCEPPSCRSVLWFCGDQHCIEAGMRWQDLPVQNNGWFFRRVVDEAVLRGLTGESARMRPQLALNIMVTHPPYVTFRFIPFDDEAYDGVDRHFIFLEFDVHTVSDVVYIEGTVGNIYPEGNTDPERYKPGFLRLRTIALDRTVLLRSSQASFAQVIGRGADEH